jgi:hypothetical protein
MTKIVVPSSTGFATSLSEFVQSEPFVPWENLLSGSRLAILLAATTGKKKFRFTPEPNNLIESEERTEDARYFPSDDR